MRSGSAEAWQQAVPVPSSPVQSSTVVFAPGDDCRCACGLGTPRGQLGSFTRLSGSLGRVGKTKTGRVCSCFFWPFPPCVHLENAQNSLFPVTKRKIAAHSPSPFRLRGIRSIVKERRSNEVSRVSQPKIGYRACLGATFPPFQCNHCDAATTSSSMS